jgi:MFS family permease
MMIQYNASYFTLTLSAPIATYINADLGPKPYYVWMTIVWPLAFAATITIDGRLGDLFGRRWLMIGGNILCVVASIIGGTAQSIGVVILAIGLNGMAGAIQQTASAAVSEIVPRKYRPQAASTVAGSGIIGGAFGTPIGIHPSISFAYWSFDELR